MTRQELIKAVKVKLEEFSPFENVESTGLQIVSTTSAQESEIRPIHVYIDNLLDESAVDVLRLVPTALILSTSNNVASFAKEAIKTDDYDPTLAYIPLNIPTDTTGNKPAPTYRVNYDDFIKVYSIRLPKWSRTIHDVITPDTDPLLYEQQGNPYLRGKIINPVVALAEGRLEMYSLVVPKSEMTSTNTILRYVCKSKAEQVQDNLQPFIVMQCAIKMMEIYNRTEAIAILNEEFKTMLNKMFLSLSRPTIQTQSK